MSFEIYHVDCGFDSFLMRIDTDQASSLISMSTAEDADGNPHWSGTQYQTADARHDVDRAAALCVKECGEDWHCEPGKSVKPSSVIKSVTLWSQPEDTEIMDDEDCDQCKAKAKHIQCKQCGVSARLTNCGHFSQPRPISAAENGEPLCDTCAASSES